MTEDIHQKIDSLIEQGYDFPASDFFSNAYTLFKQAAGSFIGFLFLSFLISFILRFIPVVGFFANTFIISPALLVGWYLFADRLKNNQRPEFDTFFKGFEHFLQLMLVAVTTSLILLLIVSPSLYILYKSGLVEWYMEIIDNPIAAQQVPDLDLNGTDTMVIILNMIPILYFSIAFLWAPLFVVFYDLTFWDAIEASRRVITRKWFSVFSFLLRFIAFFIILGFAFSILASLLSFIGGIIGFSVFVGGMIILFPVFYIAIYLSFAEVTGLHNEKTTDIFDHFVD